MRLLPCCLLALGLAAKVASAAPENALLLLISVDGLKPEAVLDAERHGLTLPALRAFITDGAYATSVRGVLPTLTYPSHTTLLTGASPAHHGIYANTTFDPLDRNQRGWYWYAEDIKVPTLWDAAATKHLSTANIYWPVSVAAHITYNLPQIWRATTDDDLKLQRALGTPGLEHDLGTGLGRYPGGGEETVADDEVRARYAIRLLETKHPAFMTMYMTGLDTEQHASGPFSEKSNATLQRLDLVVAALRAAAERTAPGHATVCLVSDHGFAAIEHDVKLYGAFLKAGLLTLDEKQHIKDWQAMPWPAGGSAAIMLADPHDAAVRQRVETLLNDLTQDPASGVERILSSEQLHESGAFPGAAYLVSFRIGYELGFGFDPTLIAAPSNLGMHGYTPDHAEMRSSFFIAGPHIARGKALGEIDMRRIAPTIAQILKVKLSGAELGPLQLN